MWMLRGIRYRIYPTKEQKVIRKNTSVALDLSIIDFFKLNNFSIRNRINISGFDLKRHLVILKEVYPWLKEVNSQSIQQACINLDTAFTNFFNFGFGYPKGK